MNPTDEPSDWLVVVGEIKRCPQCAETIQAEARACPFCGAHFEVMLRGYCPQDHEQVQLDAQDRCSRCGSEVVDRHLASRFLPEPGTGSPTAIASASAGPSQGHEQTPEAPAAMPRSGSAEPSAAPSVGVVPAAEPLKRPGCVTAYSLLLFIFAGPAALGVIALGLEADVGESFLSVAALVLGGLVTTLLIGSLARGLWLLRNWARVVVIVLQGIGMLFYVLGVVASMASSAIPGGAQLDPAMGLCSAVVGLAISASILGWFVRNRKLFDGAGQLAAASRAAQIHDVPRAKPLPLVLGISVLVLALGAVLVVLQLRPKLPGASPVEPAASSTRQATPTTRPTATDRPTRTPTPPPVEITFDELSDYPVGREVILTGRLALFSSTRCGLTCGLLLEDIANPSREITIFVNVASPGQQAEPNQMESLPDQYVKSDIRVRTDDGTYAAVGFRIRITGEICETSGGEPCISSITKIELVTVD